MVLRRFILVLDLLLVATAKSVTFLYHFVTFCNLLPGPLDADYPPEKREKILLIRHNTAKPSKPKIHKVGRLANPRTLNIQPHPPPGKPFWFCVLFILQLYPRLHHTDRLPGHSRPRTIASVIFCLRFTRPQKHVKTACLDHEPYTDKNYQCNSHCQNRWFLI